MFQDCKKCYNLYKLNFNINSLQSNEDYGMLCLVLRRHHKNSHNCVSVLPEVKLKFQRDISGSTVVLNIMNYQQKLTEQSADKHIMLKVSKKQLLELYQIPGRQVYVSTSLLKQEVDNIIIVFPQCGYIRYYIKKMLINHNTVNRGNIQEVRGNIIITHTVHYGHFRNKQGLAIG